MNLDSGGMRDQIEHFLDRSRSATQVLLLNVPGQDRVLVGFAVDRAILGSKAVCSAVAKRGYRMPAYRVQIHGENFLVELEGDWAKYGFLTVRDVVAESPAAAESLAVQMIRDDPKLRPLVQNATDDPPTMQLEDLAEIDAPSPATPTGFIWYRMQPVRRWWQFWKRW